MTKTVSLLVTSVLLALTLLASCGYRNANQGRLLYQRYFEATSPVGYGTLRAVATPAALDGDASILAQGKRYHQTADYDLALVSLRAYLESNPAPEAYLPELLAGTAAMASGYYDEARDYLERLPTEDSDADGAALWYLSLLDLREENLVAARGKLELLAASPARNQYPVGDVLGRLPSKGAGL